MPIMVVSPRVDLRHYISEAMLRRIWGEFSEMPGLRLTRKQAQRLWGLDENTCTQILEFLAEQKFLSRTGPDTYVRVSDGPVTFPRPRNGRGSA